MLMDFLGSLCETLVITMGICLRVGVLYRFTGERREVQVGTYIYIYICLLNNILILYSVTRACPVIGRRDLRRYDLLPEHRLSAVRKKKIKL